ncbi:mitochondrial import receptor subunit tom20 [Coemansia sp. RSA 1722]|nr:mitochondrial import receptor subunit tom20 [Coemansia sp. RSA 485]KAJ2589640.1 mitochondrial import receptor subunit tom20 [Coemansia sp. RSA 1722]
MVSGKSIAIAASVTAAVAGLGYIAYFDYKRRHDRKFRRKLKRDRQKVEKKAQKIGAAPTLEDFNEQAIELLDIISKEKLPESADEKEQYFMAQVSQGETLCAAGASGYAEAACRFFQALKVYPNPVELVMIYQKTTPDDVFKLVMAMMAQEVRQKQLRYFDVFPPKDKNVQIKDKNKMGAKEKKGAKKEEVVTPNRGLFATKDFAANEIVYEEDAVVSSLLPCARNGRFCYHCMKDIPDLVVESNDIENTKVESESDAKVEQNTEQNTEQPAENMKTDEQPVEESEVAEEAAEKASAEEPSAVASIETESSAKTDEEEHVAVAEKEEEKDAASEAKEEEQKAADEPEASLAQTTDTKAAPASEFTDKSSGAIECEKCHKAVYCSDKCRQDAYDAYHQFMCTGNNNSTATEFFDLVKKNHELAPIMIAKFFGVLVDREKKKELARAIGLPLDPSMEDEYTTWEHLECMRYLELIPTTGDVVLMRKLSELMSAGVPGISEFVTGDRYTMLKGKLEYNTYAVVNTAEGVKVPEDTEETHVSDSMRGSSSSGAVGLSLYLISSHLTHDCDPNVEIAFVGNTDKAAIRTLRPVAKGEELHVSFVSTELDRETRQKKLSSQYRITCSCDKCKAENAAAEEKAKAEAEAEEKAEQESEEKTSQEAEAEAEVTETSEQN